MIIQSKSEPFQAFHNAVKKSLPRCCWLPSSAIFNVGFFDDSCLVLRAILLLLILYLSFLVIPLVAQEIRRLYLLAFEVRLRQVIKSHRELSLLPTSIANKLFLCLVMNVLCPWWNAHFKRQWVL